MKKQTTYRALGRKVLLSIVKRVSINGVDLPDNASEAYRYFVVSAGNECKSELKPNDEVILLGKTIPAADVPGEKDLIVVHEDSVALVKVEG